MAMDVQSVVEEKMEVFLTEAERLLRTRLRITDILSDFFSYYIKTVISVFSGVYEHIRNRASLSDTYPYFDATSERNVTSFVGQVTHLHCTVRDIGDRTVSKTKQKMYKYILILCIPVLKEHVN